MAQAHKRDTRVLNQHTMSERKVVSVRLELPEHVYDLYEGQADKLSRDIESLMTQRLTRFAENGDNGLFFTDAQKKRLEKIVGRGIGDAEGALQHLESTHKIRVNMPQEPIEIELDAKLLQRLTSRLGAYRGQTMQSLITREALRGLKQFCGLEPM